MITLSMCLFLKRGCDLRPGGRCWAALGAYVGRLGPLLGLCWRSWPALGTYVGGLVREMWPKP